MSYFSRAILRSIKSIKHKESLWDRLVGWVDDKFHNNRFIDFYYKLQWAWANRWLLKWVWNWRSYSAGISVELFADSLIHMGRRQRDKGWGVTDKQHGRRAVAAGRALKKLYTESYEWNDKSYQKLHKDNPIVFEDHTLVHVYKQSEEFYNKLSKVVDTRIKREEEEAKRDMWAKIEKNIPYWGD